MDLNESITKRMFGDEQKGMKVNIQEGQRQESEIISPDRK
jgi:hypothetical protein